MASESLRSLHEHVLHAPWFDSSAFAPQTLPPAHEMMHTLREGTPMLRPGTTFAHSEDGHVRELAHAKETIALMEQRLNHLIDAKETSPSRPVNSAQHHIASGRFIQARSHVLGRVAIGDSICPR